MTDKSAHYETAGDMLEPADPDITGEPIFPGTYAFANDLMFNRVMQDESLCRRLLERILGIEIGKITYQRSQMEIGTGIFSRGVRLDVYVKGDDAVYDVEIQATRERQMAKRCRYYQAKIDSGLLPKGADYDELPDSYVIFICRHDPFGHALPVYTIRPTCKEEADLEVESGSTWIVLNASAWESTEDEGMRGLLEYVYNGTVAKDDHLIEEIDEAVCAINHDEDWIRMFWSVSTVEENAERRVRIAKREFAREAAREVEQKVREAEEKLREKVREEVQKACEEAREEVQKACKEAREEAREEALAEGEARYSALVTKLAREGRLEELAAAVEDPAELDALFAELAEPA